jgi:peptidoglycan/xylan/chitin deacetylase (PgdA/CDA1 family)
MIVDKPSGRRGKASVPVLTFHALDDAASPIAFPPALFKGLMRQLFDAGYHTVDLLSVAASIKAGKPFPERSFAITFDDGYQSVYEHGFPVLRQFGFTATLFLAVGASSGRSDTQRLPTLEQRRMLSWGEIREMGAAGIGFGAHTLTHPDLTRVAFDQARREIIVSKEIIENALGKAVHCFAYPYGRCDDRSRRIAKEHFACACSDRLALATGASDLFALERVDAYYLRAKIWSHLMLTPFFAGYIHLRNIPRSIRRACQAT